MDTRISEKEINSYIVFPAALEATNISFLLREMSHKTLISILPLVCNEGLLVERL
jgi:hypothetical protein